MSFVPILLATLTGFNYGVFMFKLRSWALEIFNLFRMKKFAFSVLALIYASAEIFQYYLIGSSNSEEVLYGVGIFSLLKIVFLFVVIGMLLGSGVLNILKRTFSITAFLVLIVMFFLFSVFTIIFKVGMQDFIHSFSVLLDNSVKEGADIALFDIIVSAISSSNMFNVVFVSVIALAFYFVSISTFFVSYIRILSGENGVFKVLGNSLNRVIKNIVLIVFSVVVYYCFIYLLSVVSHFANNWISALMAIVISWFLVLFLVISFYAVSIDKRKSLN